jgi:hypothetical protein
MKLPRLSYVVMPLVVAALACNTVTSAFRAADVSPSETPAPRPTTVVITPTRVPPTPAPTRTLSFAATAVEEAGSLAIPGGPTIAAAATTRRRIAEDLPLLEMLAAESYATEALSQAGQTYTFTVTLDDEQALLWGTNWCTTTDDVLRENFEHISLAFSVNGVTVDESQFLVVDVPTQEAACRYYLAVVSDWPDGETVLEISITFEDVIDDGFAEYPAGTHVYHYAVTRR